MQQCSAESRKAARVGTPEVRVRVPAGTPPIEGYTFDRKSGAFKNDSNGGSISARLHRVESKLDELLDMKALIEELLIKLNKQ